MRHRPPAKDEYVAFQDALCFFTPKTCATIARESGVRAPAVQRMLNLAVDGGTVERKGNRYRIAHAKEWR